MKRYKICVYAICKNEEQFVDRWMDSMGEADLVVVTDTGSADNTVAALRGRGARVYCETIKPWRFDTARNISLSHVPDNMDIAVCTDLDEVFLPGWRECLENSWEPGATMGNYVFNWSVKPDGTPNTQLIYFKVHKKNDYVWKCPIHEYLGYVGKGPEKKVFIKGMVLNHYPDSEKSRGSYLPLLETAALEEPENDRMAYYLGREYMYAGRWDDCISALKRHLGLPRSHFREERCASMRWIAKSYKKLGDAGEAYRWYYRAIAEAPHMRDPYVECAQHAYDLRDWPTAFYMADAALRITEKSAFYVNMGYSWDYTPNDLAAIALYRLGMYEKSREHAKKALAFEPDDKRLIQNLELIEQKIRESRQ